MPFKKGTTLFHIEEIISTQSAMDYAIVMMRMEKQNPVLTLFDGKKATNKKVDYAKYMKAMWGRRDTDTLEQCIANSMNSKLNHYAENIGLLTGFNKNGNIFVLHKEEMFVSFIYKVDDWRSTLSADPNKSMTSVFMHYNPLNVDFIEGCYNSKSFQERIVNEEFEISQKEEDIILSCDELIHRAMRGK